jgi:hypothetical protein
LRRASSGRRGEDVAVAYGSAAICQSEAKGESYCGANPLHEVCRKLDDLDLKKGQCGTRRLRHSKTEGSSLGVGHMPAPFSAPQTSVLVGGIAGGGRRRGLRPPCVHPRAGSRLASGGATQDSTLAAFAGGTRHGPRQNRGGRTSGWRNQPHRSFGGPLGPTVPERENGLHRPATSRARMRQRRVRRNSG